MAIKMTNKKAKSVNNRPNCLKIRTSAREARSMKKNSK